MHKKAEIKKRISSSCQRVYDSMTPPEPEPRYFHTITGEEVHVLDYDEILGKFMLKNSNNVYFEIYENEFYLEYEEE